LIVDDDAAFRALLATVFERAGYATTQAGTGEAALAAADGTTPLLVVLDVLLPDISGHEVLWQLRERFGRSLPIVYVSGHRTEPADRTAGLLLGADDYLIKPVAPDELVARVRRLVGGREDRSTGRSALTKRELEITCLLAHGLTEQQIAAQLSVATATVATHIQNVLGKLNVHSRAQAVAYAHEHRLCEEDRGSSPSRGAAVRASG